MTQNNKLKIIDPHIHLWDLSFGRNTWLSDRTSDLLGPLAPINKNYLKKDYLEDSEAFDVEKVIHVEAVATRFVKDEVEWLDQLYGQDAFLGGIVAGADLLDANIEDLLRFYGGHRLVKGIRQILNWSENPKYTAGARPDDLTNELWIKNFGLLQKYNLSFDMQICPEQMVDAIKLAHLCPDISIVIDHAGMPISEYGNLWEAGILNLSKCPNVFVKISGFGMFDHQWSKDSVTEYIKYVIQCFGPDRCMFASNFPVDKLYGSYSKLVNSYLQIVDAFFYQDRNKIFHDTAKRFYKL
ncbi:MAG: amidohydrolase family protein [Pseudomonadota bacterium]